MTEFEITRREALAAALGAAAATVLPRYVRAAAPESAAVSIQPAVLTRLDADDASGVFVPTGAHRSKPGEYGYVEEEWIAAGEVDGHPYRTTVYVRRPSDPSQFSGTLIVEPLHAASAAPIWIYTSRYQLRSGHAWACVCSQKSALDAHVKPFNPDRYSSLDIWSEISPDELPRRDGGLPRDPEARRTFMERMRRMNAASTPILAQVGAALRTTGPLEGFGVQHVLLVGHSQTGRVATDYILDGHDAYRFADGSPIYDGFFPSGAPGVQFGPRDVPIVQTVSEGDIADPRRPGREGRRYRRPDSDEPSDRYRLYELAGVAHMGTRYPPYNDASMWLNDPIGSAGKVTADARMNSLPHGALFSMTLHHLVQWVAGGVTPPRADRIEEGPDGMFVKDEYGNSRGGVRCAEMDVPRLKYFPNPGTNEDGTPARGVVGFEEPLRKETLQRLYPSQDDYVEAFNRRLQALIAAGWLLPEDADDLRAEAASASLF
jgi:hypothetical protein